MYLPPSEAGEPVSELEFPDEDATSLDVSSTSVTTSSSFPILPSLKSSSSRKKCFSESDIMMKLDRENIVTLSLDDIKIHNASIVVGDDAVVDSDNATEVTEEYQSENEVESKTQTEEESRKMEKVNYIQGADRCVYITRRGTT